MDLLRKLYQKAVKIPLSNVEQIWKDYDAFENGLNKLTVSVQQKAHSLGKKVYPRLCRSVHDWSRCLQRTQDTF